MPVSPPPPSRPSRVTATIQAEELPRAITAALPFRPPAGTRFRVTIEPVEESEEERRQSLQDDIAAGLEDADAGRTTDSERLFERLIAKYAKASQSQAD
ncbi:hypothetical protein E6C67_32705 [Azospirillum sp. TSA2s]|uniref:hypothetical protein n=1 Tax=Azospirillum sp. TSA2s TaxID=709810 RepID=UPI0010A9D51A|nr:hypothetical protein [Azospirillum sp. TSA2s]QCG98420.1 hypothetical protein E6C67_32705 [Azospirillum sp. TSA2s]